MTPLEQYKAKMAQAQQKLDKIVPPPQPEATPEATQAPEPKTAETPDLPPLAAAVAAAGLTITQSKLPIHLSMEQIKDMTSKERLTLIGQMQQLVVSGAKLRIEEVRLGQMLLRTEKGTRVEPKSKAKAKAAAKDEGPAFDLGGLMAIAPKAEA